MNYYSDSAFRTELSYYLAKIGQSGVTPLMDEDPNSPNFGELLIVTGADGLDTYVYDPPDTTWYLSEDIVQYRLKEDWFFDKERSVLDVRIIAMAPVRYATEKDPNGRI